MTSLFRMNFATEAKAPNSPPAEVLIVGAGPTGMTAAMELSRLQIPVRIIEKKADPPTTSRAIAVQARTLELFEQRGLVESMLQKGHQAFATSMYGDGRRLFQLEFARNGSDYGYVLLISQVETERILRTQLEKQGVTIERSTELVALAQSTHHNDFVKAIIKHRDGSLEEFNCKYLIDTEGAHSISRTTLAQDFKGKTRVEEFAIGDACISGDLPDTDLMVFSSEHGFLGVFAMGGKNFRIIASQYVSDSADEGAPPSLEKFQKMYDERSTIPARLEHMTWSSLFRINSRMVNCLKIGRVFLGGDSAHVHSPAGGQGMNTGIQDMINLSWKLALVLKGQADPKLLDTYTDDRIPVIRDVLQNTDGMTNVLDSKNFVVRKAFHLISPWVVSTSYSQSNGTARVSQILLNYRKSPLSVSHGKAVSPREVKAGDRVPNVKVLTAGSNPSATPGSEPKSLFQVLDSDRFTLLFANLEKPEVTLPAADSAVSTRTSLIQTYKVAPAPGQEKVFRSIFGLQGSFVLVRPDGYVAFAGTEQSVEALAAYLNSWFPTKN